MGFFEIIGTDDFQPNVMAKQYPWPMTGSEIHTSGTVLRSCPKSKGCFLIFACFSSLGKEAREVFVPHPSSTKRGLRKNHKKRFDEGWGTTTLRASFPAGFVLADHQPAIV